MLKVDPDVFDDLLAARHFVEVAWSAAASPSGQTALATVLAEACSHLARVDAALKAAVTDPVPA